MELFLRKKGEKIQKTIYLLHLTITVLITNALVAVMINIPSITYLLIIVVFAALEPDMGPLTFGMLCMAVTVFLLQNER